MGTRALWGDARLEWVDAGDGVRLRLARFEPSQEWARRPAGSVHIFNGRTEYIEKYHDVIERLLARGFHVSIHDWRGQGLSTRNPYIPERCHIDDFADFARDVSAIMRATHDMPSPRRLFCHSMGGAIGLRHLLGKHRIETAVFCAPMLGIRVPLLYRPIAGTILTRVRRKGNLWDVIPGASDEPYERVHPFLGNVLTSNREAYREMKTMSRKYPELGTGGPNYHWYFAAKAEMNALASAPPPDLPMLVLMGGNEKVVSNGAIREYAKRADNMKLALIKGARHEVYSERPKLLAEFWDHIDNFWGL